MGSAGSAGSARSTWGGGKADMVPAAADAEKSAAYRDEEVD